MLDCPAKPAPKGVDIVIPEIAGYEGRCGLLRADKDRVSEIL
jgi:hypothetical protein